MIRAVQLLLARLVLPLFEGGYTSGAESCEYLRRLRAVPESEAERAKAA
jgi:hypothetical protein